MNDVFIIIGDYLVENELGSGGFGIVYKGRKISKDKSLSENVNDTSGKNVVAIKIETRIEGRPNKLQQEYEIYKNLHGGKGIPQVKEYFQTLEHNVMVMPLMGPTLSQLFLLCKRRFSLKTVLMVFDQIIQRLEYVHSKGYVYRDIKPGNFVMETERGTGQVFLIDYGLTKSYIDEGKYHVPYEKQNFAGTAQFAPLNAHLNKTQSRKDDLESLGYMMIYFLKGYLPWNDIKAANKRERKQIIGNMKLSMDVARLCENCPLEFQEYFKYLNKLSFIDKPNYSKIRKMFYGLAKKLQIEYDYKYTWLRKLENKKFPRPYVEPKIEFISAKKKRKE